MPGAPLAARVATVWIGYGPSSQLGPGGVERAATVAS
jgi:hypothetical protein